MIRKFKLGDHLILKPNEHSGIGDILDVFFDDTFTKYSLEDEDDIKCIICWKQHFPKHYGVFFLMSDNISSKHARELKRFVDDIAEKMKPRSCITYSFDCDTLNRWHNFFGFEKQRKSLLDKADGFNVWLIKWD